MPRRRPAVLGRHGRHGHRRLPQAPVPRPRRSRASGIPGFAFSDGPRGVVVGNATCFPVTMARGATWDVDLEERIGEAIGRELRAVGADLYGGVCVNVLRHPAWGRAQETYGEDPHHVGEMGAALTRGVQRHVMAMREALRLQLDGERPLHRRRHRRRGGAPRGVPPPLQADRRRGRGLRDERLQRGQRRVVRAEPDPAHRRSSATSGASTASSSATGSSACATPARRSRAGLDVEMPARMIRRDGLADGPRVRATSPRPTSTRCVTRTIAAAAPPRRRR